MQHDGAAPPLLNEWLERQRFAEHEVGRMMLNRTVWRAMLQMLETNPAFPHPPFVFGIITEQYFSHQAIRVRRQRDRTEKHHQTLGRLLWSIEEHASTITRSWYVSHYGDDPMMVGIGNETFTDMAGEEADVLSPVWAQSRRERISELIQPIGSYVNKRVAHLDNRYVEVPSTEALDAAIDGMAQVVSDLALLLRAAGLDSPEPIVQFNWAVDLQVPWWVPDAEQAT